jgi:hypothetical protein
MKIINHKEIINEVVYCVKNAKNRIYTTHDFSNNNDIYSLPSKYQEAIIQSSANTYKRLCFGKIDLIKEFIRIEKKQCSKFTNIYINDIYQRMILID